MEIRFFLVDKGLALAKKGGKKKTLPFCHSSCTAWRTLLCTIPYVVEVSQVFFSFLFYGGSRGWDRSCSCCSSPMNPTYLYSREKKREQGD